MTFAALHEFTNEKRSVFAVVHPLDDAPEQKADIEHLGPIKMTKAVRICLFALRAYLLLIFGVLGFRVLQLAGVIRS